MLHVVSRAEVRVARPTARDLRPGLGGGAAGGRAAWDWDGGAGRSRSQRESCRRHRRRRRHLQSTGRALRCLCSRVHEHLVPDSWKQHLEQERQDHYPVMLW